MQGDKAVLPNNWIDKNTKVRAIIYCLDTVSEEDIHFTVDGKTKYCYSAIEDGLAAFGIMDEDSQEEQYMTNVLTANTIDIQLDQYIRYEDIVQPYPSLFTLIDYDTEEVYSWGSKLKVGTKFKGNVINLLPDMYEWQGNILYNGEVLDWRVKPGVVAKEMVFSWNMPFKYLIDNNEPKVILSPRLLRIPNSSYKLLGYIPDISGHGNHGVIHNSAYEGESGANGRVDCSFSISNSLVGNRIIFSDDGYKMSFTDDRALDIHAYPGQATIGGGKARVTGMKSGSYIRFYTYPEFTVITEDGIYDIPYIDADSSDRDVMYFSNCKGVTIEGIGEYEGAYCLDGVDDHITIPTVTGGGKQVLMKVDNNTINSMLYDQRSPGASPNSLNNDFAIYSTNTNDNNLIAYQARLVGKTYIDGILNTNITCEDLLNVLHNITITCDIVAPNNGVVPYIGVGGVLKDLYSKVALYDFMLFDNISTDDKIKELNEYVGIEAKVEIPSYYWDNYGKKNTDARRGYIDEQVSLQKTGTSVNPLENFNIGYEGMSGYNGYPVVFGANKTWETSNAIDYIYDINSTIVHITNVKHASNGLLYSYVKRKGALANIKEIPAFRVTVKGLEENSKLIYKYLATENATKESIVYLGNGTHKLPKSFVPTDALLDLTTNSWIGFAITPMIEGELVFDCDITIEILPEYENGLVYDGVSDFTDNKNIPIFTDFTAIIKRVDLDAKNDNSTVMFKRNKIYESSIGNGFILDYCYNSKNYIYSYGKLNQIIRDDSKIIYLTPESYNGNPIIKGENRDNLGLVLGKYWKGIIYKTILYSKTISLLEINFLKNLMEKDEIIDINHPIFISNTEDESNTSQDT